MFYTVYAPDDHIVGRACSLKRALALLPPTGKFCILRRQQKNSVVDSGYSGEDGKLYRHTMLLYPKGALCKQWTPEEYLRDSLHYLRSYVGNGLKEPK